MNRTESAERSPQGINAWIFVRQGLLLIVVIGILCHPCSRGRQQQSRPAIQGAAFDVVWIEFRELQERDAATNDEEAKNDRRNVFWTRLESLVQDGCRDQGATSEQDKVRWRDHSSVEELESLVEEVDLSQESDDDEADQKPEKPAAKMSISVVFAEAI